jgi:hypothetical protein
MMMQPTHLWDLPDRANLWPLDRPRQRTIQTWPRLTLLVNPTVYSHVGIRLGRGDVREATITDEIPPWSPHRSHVCAFSCRHEQNSQEAAPRGDEEGGLGC